MRKDLPRAVAPGSRHREADRCVGASPGGSYMEVWISASRIDVFERQGDGKTARLIEALRKLGLEMRARTVSFCG
ncbi:MAG TPA: hypothetical protein GX510_08440 [Firmicutes bacterium]|nr:hypothetical protein [Candidatus Fermentithermobacillaceae bacterium]